MYKGLTTASVTIQQIKLISTAASKNKLQKHKRSHDNAHANGSQYDSTIVPFAEDTLGNFYSVAITF